MTEEEILKYIGLPPEKLKSLFQEFNRFLNSLEPEQRQALLRSFKPPQAVVAELGKGATHEDLQEVLKKYAPPDCAVFTICACSPLSDPTKAKE